MEKITLKPNVKELIYKSNEDNVHFDVLSYQGAGSQEKTLGSLFILGHIKYSEEDLSYAISLASSLAKREYYSDESLRGQNAKSAFEHTLKKLNEVLDDFFQNKNFKLNIGLAVISGDNIYISRLGKFKIALARGGKYIDILNNVELFVKDAEGERQFSNIISGKIQPNDKIFAYFPLRSITSREKQLNVIFVKENQEEFSQKIANLAANATNFACCGVHIDIREVKEIPVSTAAYTKSVVKTRTASAQMPDGKEKETGPATPTETQNKEKAVKPGDAREYALVGQDRPSDEGPQDVPDAKMPETDPETEQSRIIPAEFQVSKRKTILTPMVKGFGKLVSAGKLGERARRRGFILIAAVVLLPLLLLVLFKAGGISGEEKNILKQAGENFKLAQAHLNQSNFKDARSLLQASLIGLADITGKKADETKKQINQTLDGLDRVSDKQPVLFADLFAQTDLSPQNKDFKANFITALQDQVYTTDASDNVFAVSQNEVSPLGQLKTNPQFIFSTLLLFAVFNGSDTFDTYDLKTQKINAYSLKEPVPAADAILYESNLYTLSGNAIYKYTDAATGGTKRVIWASDNASGNLTAISADGNIYALNADGKLIKYFKGKKTGELDLQVIPSSGSRIFTYKDSAFIYLADKTNKRIYVFDKENGSLKTAYKLDPAGALQDIFVSPDSTVWILSTDNKIWVIK